MTRDAGSAPPALEQLALADFLARGELDRHLRRMRMRYRERRRATLEGIAVRAAEQAIVGERVLLEPMTAVERKVVHERLKDVAGVETSSEGTEPNRYVVVSPA